MRGRAWCFCSRAAASGGVLQRYFRSPSDGRESVTAFVNGVDGSDFSWVFEFGLSLAPQGSETGTSAAGGDGDGVFATTYAKAPCPFLAFAQGGARPIGHAPGQRVWLASTGTAEGGGLACVDQTEAGGSVAWPFGSFFYDPFTFITV
jgi:hypothetical protein